MARRRKKTRRTPQRRKHTRVTFPFVLILAEGKEQQVSFSAMLGKNPNMFANMPWRLTSVSMQASTGYHNKTGDNVIYDPAVIQVYINEARKENVEAIASSRFLVSQPVTKHTIRVPSPNLWKEDEDRTQTIFSIQHVPLSDNAPTIVTFLVNATFEFGQVVFTQTKSIPVLRGNQQPEPEESTLCPLFKTLFV